MFMQIESAIKQAVTDTLGRSVLEVASHPGRWGDRVIKHMLNNAPAVYIGFSAGSYQDAGDDQLLGQWHVFVVARALNGQKEAGIYQLVERLLPALHGLDLGQEDSLRFKRVKNLFSFAEAQSGFSCYQMDFDLPMSWPNQVDIAALDDWLAAHGDHLDLNDLTHVMASDDVTMPT